MNRKILRQCLSVARSRRHKEKWFRHFSFIIVDNSIISVGLNYKIDYMLYGWHAGASRNRPDNFTPYRSKMHSEFDAFRKVPWITDFECVNIRLSRNKETKNSAPCPCCSNFLRLHGCTHIYYTEENDAFIRYNG